MELRWWTQDELAAFAPTDLSTSPPAVSSPSSPTSAPTAPRHPRRHRPLTGAVTF